MKDETKDKIIKILGNVVLPVGGYLASIKIYNTIFKRLERPDYSIYPGLYNYQRIKSFLPRKELTFISKGERLEAYYYEADNPKGLVVLVHGFHSGSDDYLPITMYLVKNGYNVFSYDGCGTYGSTGDSLKGFSQGLVDLDYALKFIKNNKFLKKQKLFLLGHSCGGFAVNAVLNIYKKGISGVASIAAVNNCYKLLIDKGDEYAGEIASTGFPADFLDSHQKKIFGKYIKYTALDGVNSVNVPIFIAHGDSDETISYELQSLISHKDEIINPNVIYLTTTGNQGGHTSIWHSKRSNDYQEIVDQEIKRMKKDKLDNQEIAKYVMSVDNYLYSEINFDLFDKIIEMFDKAK